MEKDRTSIYLDNPKADYAKNSGLLDKLDNIIKSKPLKGVANTDNDKD